MEFRNQTEEKVLTQIIGTHVWSNIQKRGTPIKIELIKWNERSYAIYNNGVHTGTFIGAFFVDLNEIKELGWKVKGKIENPVDPDTITDKPKKKRRKKKEEIK